MAAGCTQPYGVRETTDEAYFRSIRHSALTGSRASEGTAQFLRQEFPDEAERQSRSEAIRRLIALYGERPSREAAFALAELCYLEGKKRGAASDEGARHYLTSALFAYAFLFDPEIPGACSPFDRRYRMACDLYNRSLSRIVTHRMQSPEHWGEAATLPSLVGPVRVEELVWKMPWPREQYEPFSVAYRFEVTGIDNHSRQEGLGVPLIAPRSARGEEQATPVDAFLPRGIQQDYPATLVAMFRGSVASAARGDARGLSARVMVFDTIREWDVEIEGRNIDLEADYTTPLAYMIENSPRVSGFEGFMNVPAWEKRRGLMMLHPYQPGKIPVVFVYGLMGKPMTWVPMVNTLLSDPVLRARYQFWYFSYPTGNPVIYSAAVLREELNKARRLLDPDGGDAAFDRMVIVGHSMGGLVSRLQVTTSGDALWKLVVDRPLESLDVEEPMRKLLRSVFFFDALPFVKRAVFMATPHRGSELADTSFAGMFGSKITLPPDVLKAIAALKSAEGATGIFADRTPTAVDSLSARQPVLDALERLPIAPHVQYHSIICNHEAADTPGGTDMIVPYTSSHLDGTVSEKIIKSGHSCTRNAAAIYEVKRILLHHLASVDETITRR